jgi:transcriptional regulator with XRE-family HTH domain
MNIKSLCLEQTPEPHLKPHLAVLGENVRRRRLDCKLSQKLLAGRSGLHRTYISDVERAARNISLASLLRLATALETTISELMTDVGELSPPASKRGLIPAHNGAGRKGAKIRAIAVWRRVSAVMDIETCILDSFGL